MRKRRHQVSVEREKSESVVMDSRSAWRLDRWTVARRFSYISEMTYPALPVDCRSIQESPRGKTLLHLCVPGGVIHRALPPK